MKIIRYLFLLLLISCQSRDENGNEYLLHINDEVSVLWKQPEKADILYKNELDKYKKSKNELFLISSKYIQFFAYSFEKDKGKLKQIPAAYELLKVNNNRYEYVSIACNLNLALQIEHDSPSQSLKFLNEAIRIDESTGKEFFLAHLYHSKGRWYFNHNDYSKALEYFRKALNTYKNSDVLYIASMHNNFGMCYEKMNKLDMAILEANKSVTIFRTRSEVVDEYYLNFFRGYLASYLFKNKDYKIAEELMIREFEFYRENPEHFHEAIAVCKRLYDLYFETQQTGKMNGIISFLINAESGVKNISDQIIANEIIQNYNSMNNDLAGLKSTARKLELLHQESDRNSKTSLRKTSDVLNNYIIKSIDQKSYAQHASYKRNILIVVMSAASLIIIFLLVIINTKRKNKIEKESAENAKLLLENERLVLENDKKDLEQDIKLQKDKIRDLHLNLNLKVETEKAFLEHLKTVKRSKSTHADTEQLVKDLHFKITNLIQIDKKKFDFIDASSAENKKFMKILSERFPDLTPQEVKLSVYFKLNLSTKEVSILENITDGSARVYKTKIKSKLGLGKDESLDTYFKTIH